MKKITLFLMLVVPLFSANAQTKPNDSFSGALNANHDSLNYLTMSLVVKQKLVPLLQKYGPEKLHDFTVSKSDYVISLDFSYRNDSSWSLRLCQDVAPLESADVRDFDQAWESFYAHQITRLFMISASVTNDFLYEKRLGICGYTRGGNIGDREEAFDFLIAALSVF